MPSPAPSSPPVFPEIGSAQKRQYARFQAFLPARCRLRGPKGEPLELEGKTRNVSEGGLLLLLPRVLPEGIPLRGESPTASIPILALTAYPEDFPAEALAASGCTGYLTKPISRDLLREALRHYLPED